MARRVNILSIISLRESNGCWLQNVEQKHRLLSDLEDLFLKETVYSHPLICVLFKRMIEILDSNPLYVHIMATSLQDIKNNLFTDDMSIVWLAHKFGRLIKDEHILLLVETIKEETL
jgi:hypothetical protein